MCEARAHVLDEGLVDRLVARPARASARDTRAAGTRRGGGSGTSSPPRRPSAVSSGRPSIGPTSTSCRTSGRIGSSGRSSADCQPHATTSTSRVELARVGVLAHLHPAFGRAADQLARRRGRIRDAVLAADHAHRARRPCEARAPRPDRRPRPATPSPRWSSARAPQTREPVLGRREEQVADLVEERRAELLEEVDRRLREPHLRRGRELLAHAAHRLAGRAGCDLARVAENDVAPHRAARGGTRSTRPSRPRRLRQFAVEPRVELRPFLRRERAQRARTSSRIGTPRRATMRLSAACRGKRSIVSRISCKRGSTATTFSGRALASAETAPTAPCSRPCAIRDSGPTKTSSPSSRYGRNASHGESETFMPARFGARSRSRSIRSRRHRVTARARELVDVERQRVARAAAASKCAAARGRRAGSTAARSRPRRQPAASPHARRARRSRASSARRSDDHLERPGEEQLGRAHPLLRARAGSPRRSCRGRGCRRARRAAGSRGTARRRPRRARPVVTERVSAAAYVFAIGHYLS